MKDLKITKGEWILEKSSNFSNRTNVYANGKKHTAIEDYTRTEQEANAQLITEAGNVANETGLMPRELLDERDTYKAILNDIRDMWNDNEVNMRTINDAMEAFESYLATE